MLLIEGHLVCLTVIVDLGDQLLQERVQHHALCEKDEVDTRKKLHDCFRTLSIDGLQVTKLHEQGNTDHGWDVDAVEGQLLAHPLALHPSGDLEKSVDLLWRLLVLFEYVF